MNTHPVPKLVPPAARSAARRARLAGLVLLALVFQLTTTIAIVLAADRFTDVPNSHWAHDAINRFADLGITTGCGPNAFCPDDNVTRAQMAVFFDRAFRHIPRHNPAPPRANTITTIDSAGNVGDYTAITIGVDGLPIISYRDRINLDLKVVHCGNAACTSGNTITVVDSPGNVGASIAITIGADGLPIISYFDGTNTALKVAHCGNPQCTSGNLLTTVDNSADVGYWTSITIGVDGLPIISYFDTTFDNLKVVHCGNTQCTAGNTITTVDNSANNVGEYTSIAIGADGLPIISYFDRTVGDLKVAHCGNRQCTAGNTITILDSGGGVGYFTSITIGVDGLPIMSYWDFTNNDLKVAHCGNRQCTVGVTRTTVDSTGDVGNLSSITIGIDGLPIISYRDHTNGALKVARCGNWLCNDANSLLTIDSIGDVGLWTSITIGADGLPIISHFADTNDDLKVAHLGSVLGLPYWRRR